MDLRKLVGGALPPREDAAWPRVAFRVSVGALPPETYTTLGRPQHQLHAGSCVAHAVDLVLGSEALGRTGAVLQLCRQDLYFGARWLVGDEARDVGSYPDRMAQWIGEHGTVSEVLRPYDPSIVTTWRPPAAWVAERLAFRASLPALPRDRDQLRAELAANRPVMVCHAVDAQLVDEAGVTGIERGMTGPSLGGHARALIGYSDARQAFLVANSWRGWGVPHPKRATDPRLTLWDHGCSWLPYTVAVDPGWAWDYRRVGRGLAVEV